MSTLGRRPSEAIDEYLVVECQLGNSDAFNALVRRWQGQFVLRAQTFTRDREAALEVAQESWLGIIRGLRRLRDPGQFRSWAMRIVANKSRDWIRRERARRGVAEEARLVEPQETARSVGQVRDGLAALEPSQRALLSSHYFENHSLAEIASELGIPIGTVKSRLSTARNQLRLRLEED